MTVPIPNQTKRLSCILCSKHFQWKSGLSRHMKLFHLQNKAKNYRCEVCHKLFSKQTGLRIHLKHHTGETHFKSKRKYSQIYANPTKEVVYSSDSDCEYEVVKTVKKLNAESLPFKCKWCGVTFSVLENLEKHLLKRHKEKTASNNISLRRGLEPYCSSFCDKIFAKKAQFDNHTLKHKDLVKLSSATENRQKCAYRCVICGKAYRRSGCLSIHMRNHNDYKPHLCSVCGKNFTTKRYLMMHLRTHSEDKPFKCQHCNKEFIQKGNLVEHLRIHTGVKPYTCNSCGKCFTHYSGLTQHALIHSSIKKHICEICGKSFRLPAHYREHLRTHSGDKPFACKFCNRAFANSSSLLVHLRTHTGERPFKCNICEKGFIKSYGLKQHRKAHAACNTVKTTKY